MNKSKKEVKQKAIKQAERIFMKNNPELAMKDGSFPKAGENMPSKYNREAIRTEKQVVKTQLDNYKRKKKSEPKKSIFSKIKNLI